MTDTQLMDVMVDLNKKLIYASRFSNSYEMVAQIESMLDLCEFTLSERQSKDMFVMMNKGVGDETELTGSGEKISTKTNGETLPKRDIGDSSFRRARSSRPIKDT